MDEYKRLHNWGSEFIIESCLTVNANIKTNSKPARDGLAPYCTPGGCNGVQGRTGGKNSSHSTRALRTHPTYIIIESYCPRGLLEWLSSGSCWGTDLRISSQPRIVPGWMLAKPYGLTQVYDLLQLVCGDVVCGTPPHKFRESWKILCVFFSI